jgi:isoleucyl-tRNA synthetase
MLIVSDVVIAQAIGGVLEAVVSRVPGGKCLRCWNYSDYVGTSSEHPEFCRRCDDVVSGRAR